MTFSPLDVIYGISYSEVENQYDMEQVSCNYEPSFKTLDSYDYSSIGKMKFENSINMSIKQKQ